MKRNYYAAYNNMASEVLVFRSKPERDAWVADPEAMLDRIAISAADARILVGSERLRRPVYDADCDLWAVDSRV